MMKGSFLMKQVVMYKITMPVLNLPNCLKCGCPAYHLRSYKQTEQAAWGNKVKGTKDQFHLLI